MNPIPSDVELDLALAKLKVDERKIDEQRREGRGYDLMKTLKRIELESQLAQARLAELP
jgi:hypothetical protein